MNLKLQIDPAFTDTASGMAVAKLIQRLALLALGAATVTLAGGCANHRLSSSALPSCCATHREAAAPFTDQSLYQLDSSWTTDKGQDMKLGQLRGRVQVVAMFFANCQSACPFLVQDMKRIEAGLSPEARAQTGFILVSFDTQRDTPQALRTYRLRQGLDAERWTLLRGAPDDLREFAALLGVTYKQDSRGDFAHSNLITVLNADGEIIHQQAGLNHDGLEAIQVIDRVFRDGASRVAHE